MALLVAAAEHNGYIPLKGNIDTVSYVLHVPVLYHKVDQPRSSCSRFVNSFVSQLKACSQLGDLQKGAELHAAIVKLGVEQDKYVASALLNMYAKCGRVADAWMVFERMQEPDAVAWNALIFGYAENGEAQTALQLFACMGPVCTNLSFVAALKACAAGAEGDEKNGKALFEGMAVHAMAASGCFWPDVLVENKLIDLYSKCQYVNAARRVFDNMQHRTVVSWNTLMFGYTENGDGLVALDLFSRMESECCLPTPASYVAALKACSSLVAVNASKTGSSGRAGSLHIGMAIHYQASRNGYETHQMVANTLVDMYGKFKQMLKARRVFHTIVRPDVVSWTALITGYAENGQGSFALELFEQMDCSANSVTFVAALKACSSLAAQEKAVEIDGKLIKVDALGKGRSIHSDAVRRRCDTQTLVAGSLVEMYSRCGSLVDARKVFDRMARPSVASWTCMILGYAEHGEAEGAMQLCTDMLSRGVIPDVGACVAGLKACACIAQDEEGKLVEGKLVKLRSLQLGTEVHAQAVKVGLDANILVASTLVSMYSKCGDMIRARNAFDKITEPDVISWNTLIFGYAENGEGQVALDVFQQMRTQSCWPDPRTFAAVLKACGGLISVKTGRSIHAEICQRGLEKDPVVANSLLDFYGKCGLMVEAEKVFEELEAKDLVTWNTLISAYSRQGDAFSVFRLFRRMEDAGVRPDGVTFVSLLTACTHAGITEKAKHYFERMKSKYGIVPSLNHYSCMVDILSRSKQLDEAAVMVKSMPMKPNSVIWTSLLGACNKWKNLDLGMLAFGNLIDMDPDDPVPYVLMSNVVAKDS